MTSLPTRQSCADMGIGEEGAAIADTGRAGRRRRCRDSSSRLRGSGNRRRSTASKARRGYFRSCGGWPIEAKGKMRVRAPMVVRPATTTWLTSSTPSPSTTFGPDDGRTGRCDTSRRASRRPRRPRLDESERRMRWRRAMRDSPDLEPPVRRSRTSMALISASAHERCRRPSPRPIPPHVAALLAAWSCGSRPRRRASTGLRNLALSIVMK